MPTAVIKSHTYELLIDIYLKMFCFKLDFIFSVPNVCVVQKCLVYINAFDLVEVFNINNIVL